MADEVLAVKFPGGVSDKYGHVMVEKQGTTEIGFEEPVALFRAQDKFALAALRDYRLRCVEAGCAQEHIDGIDRQIEAFTGWQARNATRLPGPLDESNTAFGV